MTRTKAYVNLSHVESTLRELQRAGKTEGRECVVLWLGRRTEKGFVVSEILIPEQEAGEDCFYIPPTAMDALMARLREMRGMVVAQVHSHPQEAFHSRADDKWAIIRHDRALSIVVPYFGTRSTAPKFFSSSKVFEFLARNWVEVPDGEVQEAVEVEHEP